MHQHTSVGNIIGMEVGDFEVVGRLRRFQRFQRHALYFTERAVGEENFVAAL